MLAELPEEERGRIAALPEAERQKAECRAVDEHREKRHAKARKTTAAEVEVLLDLPAEERANRTFPFRVKDKLFRLGIWDRKILERVGQMSRKELEWLDKEIRRLCRMRDHDERHRAVRKLKARLSR